MVTAPGGEDNPAGRKAARTGVDPGDAPPDSGGMALTQGGGMMLREAERAGLVQTGARPTPFVRTAMQRHLLLTLGHDQTSWYKLDFIGDLFPDKAGVQITLFCVSQKPGQAPPDPSCGGRSPAAAPACGSEDLALLEEARGRLVNMGFPPDNLFLKVACSGRAALDEITCEGSGGLYDATVLGRRGLTWMEELVADSVSSGLLLKRVDFPVWVCRRRTNGERGVLLCVNHARHSLRMADHVGFVLGPESTQPVTVLHVGREEEAPEVLAAAAAELAVNGFPTELVRTVVREDGNVARAILEEAGQGNYLAVAVGMSPDWARPLETVFPAHMSFKLLRKLDAPALWVSR